MTSPEQFPAQPTESDHRALASLLRSERVGGVLLAIGAVIGLIWANSPWASTYLAIQHFEFGPEAWHLRLSVHDWVA
ncbi:MAG: Na+/H+ antiporter NhaA, partial [Agromyces sp.]